MVENETSSFSHPSQDIGKFNAGKINIRSGLRMDFEKKYALLQRHPTAVTGFNQFKVEIKKFTVDYFPAIFVCNVTCKLVESSEPFIPVGFT